MYKTISTKRDLFEESICLRPTKKSKDSIPDTLPFTRFLHQIALPDPNNHSANQFFPYFCLIPYFSSLYSSLDSSNIENYHQTMIDINNEFCSIIGLDPNGLLNLQSFIIPLKLILSKSDNETLSQFDCLSTWHNIKKVFNTEHDLEQLQTIISDYPNTTSLHKFLERIHLIVNDPPHGISNDLISDLNQFEFMVKTLGTVKIMNEFMDPLWKWNEVTALMSESEISKCYEFIQSESSSDISHHISKIIQNQKDTISSKLNHLDSNVSNSLSDPNHIRLKNLKKIRFLLDQFDSILANIKNQYHIYSYDSVFRSLFDRFFTGCVKERSEIVSDLDKYKFRIDSSGCPLMAHTMSLVLGIPSDQVFNESSSPLFHQFLDYVGEFNAVFNDWISLSKEVHNEEKGMFSCPYKTKEDATLYFYRSIRKVNVTLYRMIECINQLTLSSLSKTQFEYMEILKHSAIGVLIWSLFCTNRYHSSYNRMTPVKTQTYLQNHICSLTPDEFLFVGARLNSINSQYVWSTVKRPYTDLSKINDFKFDHFKNNIVPESNSLFRSKTV